MYLTNALSRTLYGKTQYNRPSRFVSEIESELLQGKGNGAPGEKKAPAATFAPKVFKPQYKQPVTTGVPGKKETSAAGVTWKVGDKVEHKKWGQGTVVRVGGSQKDLELDVAFPSQGIKRLLAAFAPITKV